MKVRKLAKGRHSRVYRWHYINARSLKTFRRATRDAYEQFLIQERLTGVRHPYIDYYERHYLTKQNGGV